MVFASQPFLFGFLPVCLALYFMAPTRRIKNYTLTVSSLVFYAWGEPVWVVLLVFSSLQDYVCGRIIAAKPGTVSAKAALWVSMIGNLGLLFTFKYLDFALDSVGLLIGGGLPATGLIMPIGISFYTFQTMSYTLDIYRGKINVQKNFMTFLMFVSSFPQLIAGPIVRYAEVEDQLMNRRETLQGAADGTMRFLIGLGKKVLIANYAGRTAELFLADMTALGAGEAWLGILFFAFQIYFDFSGYSDMAIGLGMIFGFKFPENFRYPYMALSVTDFWRRWHMTLGRFFRDYVYIPLGGNRRLQTRNLLVTWFLTGLWHGASWNFVLWGLYYGVLLYIEKRFLSRFLEKYKPLAALYMTVCTLAGWGLFYFTDFADTRALFAAMFGFRQLWIAGSGMLLLNNLFLLALCFLAMTPLAANLARRFKARAEASALTKELYGASVMVAGLALLIFSTASLVASGFNPFLYFRF